MLTAVCVAAGHAKPIETILISATDWVADNVVLNQPTVDFYRSAFPNATVTYGNYGDTSNATVQATLLGADLLVIARTNYSSDYTTDDDTWWNNNLTIPIIVHSSYFTRAARMNWEGDGEQAPGIDGNETTVTAEGAKIFGAEGTFDWWSGTGAFDRVGSGTVGTGKILATIGGFNAVVGWRAGDVNARGTTMLGDRLLFNFHVNGGGLPDTAAGQQALLAAVRAYTEPDTPFMPHEPAVLPANEDGSAGTLQANNEDVEVTLSFKAALNEEQTAVNPEVLGHYIYLTNGTSDPNLYLLDYVPHTDWNEPTASYGPLVLVNAQGKTFTWKVEEAVNDGEGQPKDPGDPNNIMGNEWTFTAVGANPHILSGPVHTLTDAGGNATLSITTGAVANNFRWYKVVGVKDAPDGETDDILLTDGGIYSTTTTKTLTFTGAAADGSDDGQFYAIAYNGDPETPGVPSVSSVTAWVWFPRLVNHYTFETLTEGVIPDVVSGYDMTVLSNDTGMDVPLLDAGVPELGGFGLAFDNPRGTDPNAADGQYAQVSEGWAGAYKDVTISAWVYSGGGSNWNRILDFGNDNANYMFLCINPGGLNRAVRFAVNVNGAEQSVTSPGEALPDNQWTYVTATLTGSTGRLYINGELRATNTSLTNDPITYGPTTQNWLGRSQWGAGDGYFNGRIDELKIYNYALSTEQIAQDYLDVRGEWICNRELYDLAYDFNGNCVVDLSDLAMFAATWLNSYRIYPD
jgi:hypothetical protein